MCGLAYGTLSNPNQVDRTATEIKASKQRSYTTVSNMQKAWDNGLDGLIEIMNTLCDLYGITPAGEIQKLCSWGDGVLEDTEVGRGERIYSGGKHISAGRVGGEYGNDR